MRRILSLILVVTLVVCVGAGRATAATPTQLFRVFLTNGTALVCWGEYARVGDRLVLTVPIGTGPRTAYEFVSIPIDQVDLLKTERTASA